MDRWRDNFWIARFNSALGYTGPYSIWQATYTEPGEKYGVQSDTVDVDFVMEELTFTGIKATSKDILPSLTNDTYKNELWLPKAKATATLLTDEPSESEGGQKIFWSSDNEDVATVNKHGEVKAKADGHLHHHRHPGGWPHERRCDGAGGGIHHSRLRYR